MNSRVAKRSINRAPLLEDSILEHGIIRSHVYDCHFIVSETEVRHVRYSRFEEVMEWIAQFSPKDAIAVNGTPISGNKKLIGVVLPLLLISKGLTATQAA